MLKNSYLKIKKNRSNIFNIKYLCLTIKNILKVIKELESFIS